MKKIIYGILTVTIILMLGLLNVKARAEDLKDTGMDTGDPVEILYFEDGSRVEVYLHVTRETGVWRMAPHESEYDPESSNMRISSMYMSPSEEEAEARSLDLYQHQARL